MRYTSSHPRAFHNRITRYLGILVGAALVAVLLLPATAQAQDLGTDGVKYTDADGFTLTWGIGRITTGFNNWIVTVTKPNGTKVVVNSRSDASSTLGAVEDEAATSLGEPKTRTLTYDQGDLGTWWFQVTACFMDLEGEPTEPGKCRRMKT